MRTYNLVAYYIAEEVQLNKIEEVIKKKPVLKKIDKVVYKFSAEKFLIVYDFGSIVTLNFYEKEVDEIIEKLRKICVKSVKKPIAEIYSLVLNPKIKRDVVKFEEVLLKRFEQKKFEIISRVLAQSVALEYYEYLVDKELEEIGKINEYITKYGKLHTSHKNVIKMTGETSSILQKSLSTIAVLDKPSLTWEYKELEDLFVKLRRMFELEVRFKNLKFKIDYINSQLSQFLDIQRAKTEQRLELIIIILILLEIIIYLIEILR